MAREAGVVLQKLLTADEWRKKGRDGGDTPDGIVESAWSICHGRPYRPCLPYSHATHRTHGRPHRPCLSCSHATHGTQTIVCSHVTHRTQTFMSAAQVVSGTHARSALRAPDGCAAPHCNMATPLGS